MGVLHRPVDLVFNWMVPALLLWAAARYTQRVAGDDDHDHEQVPGSTRAGS